MGNFLTKYEMSSQVINFKQMKCTDRGQVRRLMWSPGKDCAIT